MLPILNNFTWICRKLATLWGEAPTRRGPSLHGGRSVLGLLGLQRRRTRFRLAVTASALMLAAVVVTGSGASSARAVPPGGGAVFEVDEQLDQPTSVQVTPGRRAVAVSWSAAAG